MGRPEGFLKKFARVQASFPGADAGGKGLATLTGFSAVLSHQLSFLGPVGGVLPSVEEGSGDSEGGGGGGVYSDSDSDSGRVARKNEKGAKIKAGRDDQSSGDDADAIIGNEGMEAVGGFRPAEDGGVFGGMDDRYDAGTGFDTKVMSPKTGVSARKRRGMGKYKEGRGESSDDDDGYSAGNRSKGGLRSVAGGKTDRRRAVGKGDGWGPGGGYDSSGDEGGYPEGGMMSGGEMSRNSDDEMVMSPGGKNGGQDVGKFKAVRARGGVRGGRGGDVDGGEERSPPQVAPRPAPRHIDDGDDVRDDIVGGGARAIPPVTFPLRNRPARLENQRTTLNI